MSVSASTRCRHDAWRREAVLGSVARTLSELAYLSVVEDDCAGGEMVVAGEVIFRDRHQPWVAGSLSLAFDALASSTVAATMMARSDIDSLSLADRQDAAQELVHVATGNLLSVLFGMQREFAMSLPCVRRGPREILSPWIGLRCDHGSIALCYSMD